MPETPYTKFRLGQHTLDDLSKLSASAGNLSAAVRECVAHWYSSVSEAARHNATELTREEWHLLANTGDPSSPYDGTDEAAIRYPDWSAILARKLVGMWEGKAIVLPSHKEEKKLAERLAKKIGGWGRVRGYALMAAVRWFWKHEVLNIENWWWPEVWMLTKRKGMTAAEMTALVNEELSHIADGPKGPQTLLRSHYNMIRRKALGPNPWPGDGSPAGVLASCIAQIRKDLPDFVPQYDTDFFGPLPTLALSGE